MKGVIHIIEIIIITIATLIVLSQFSFIPRVQNTFDSTQLTLLGNDMLFVMFEKGVSILNQSEINHTMSTFLAGSPILYDLEIQNAIKTPIFVGCVCTDAEKSLLEGVLMPFTLNGEKVEFSIERLEPQIFLPQDVTLPLKYDVIVMFGSNLTGTTPSGSRYTYKEEMKKFVGAGKGLVHIRDLDQQILANPSNPAQGNLYRDFFGVRFNGLLSPDPQGRVSLIPGPGPRSFPIPLYFHHIPLSEEDFTESTPLDFSPVIGTWVFNHDAFDTNSTFAFASYDKPLPENYTVRFNFSITHASTRFGWTPSFQNQTSLILGGATSTGIVIGTQDILNGIPNTNSNSTLISLSPDRSYDFVFERSGNHLAVRVRDNTGWKDVSYTFPSLPGGHAGLIGNNSNPLANATIDNLRVTVTDVSFNSSLGPSQQINLSGDPLNTASPILTQPSTNVVAMTANQNIVLSQGDNPLPGRAVWMTAGLHNGTLEGKNLVRAAVAWAAGGDYHMISTPIRNPTTTTVLKTLDKDMFQPLTIILKLGYPFR